MPNIVESHQTYRSAFEQAERAAADMPAWLRDLRRRGMASFERLGFPTSKDEEWRFTSVAPIAGRAFASASAGPAVMTAADLEEIKLGDVAGQIVFVDGRFSPALSRLSDLGAVLQAGSLAEALVHEPDLLEHHLGRLAGFEQAFTALNTAFLSDGAYVRIPAGAVVEKPIHLIFASGDGGAETVSHPRVLVLAGPNSQATVVETYVAPAGAVYFTNPVTELVVGENATLDHYKVVRDSKRAFHVASMHVALDRSSNFSSHSITLGGGLVRNEVMALLNGEGIDCTLNGLYLVDGQRLVDNHTTIDHAKPHCGSHELYKGILDGRGRAVFNGKIIVRPDAQKTDAKQTNKALLLSEDGQINTKPQLEIFADDVKCTHGATVGQLDEDALFYLRARGIGQSDARNMLIHAFAGDVLTKVKVGALREQLEAVLSEQLQRR